MVVEGVEVPKETYDIDQYDGTFGLNDQRTLLLLNRVGVGAHA